MVMPPREQGMSSSVTQRERGDVLKAGAVVRGRNVEDPQERAAHRIRAAKTACAGNLGKASMGFLQPSAGGLDPQAFDKSGRRPANLLAEHAGKVARTHMGASR